MSLGDCAVHGVQRHVRASLRAQRQDRYLFYVPARQSDIPDNAELRPLNFSFPGLIYFSSFWPPLSPRQFSHRKSAESAKLFHSEVELGCVERPRLQFSDYQNTVNPFPHLTPASSLSCSSLASLAAFGEKRWPELSLLLTSAQKN